MPMDGIRARSAPRCYHRPRRAPLDASDRRTGGAAAERDGLRLPWRVLLDDVATGGAVSSETDHPAADARPSPEDPVADRPTTRPRPRLRARQRLGRGVRDLQRLRPADLRRPDHVHEPALDHRSRRAPAPRRRRRDRRRAVRRRRQPPAGRPLRAAGDPRGAVHLGRDPLAPARRRPVRGPDRRRRRRREHRAGLDRARPRDDLPQGPRGRRDRRDPDHPRRRPLDHLAGGDGHRRGPPPGQHRDRPFRRPRRHRHRHLRRAGQPRDADAPPHRVGRGQGQELRPGRPARLLAAAGDLRLDAGAGPALALHARDRGARRRGGHRRRDRRGARRPGRDLPLARHRRHRSRAWRPGPGRPSRAGC